MTSEPSWPTWRDALSYRLGYLQATVDIHKMQQQTPPKSGDGMIQSILSRGKAWAEGYELARKLWGMQRRLALPVLIASWWDYLIWLIRLIVG